MHPVSPNSVQPHRPVLRRHPIVAPVHKQQVLKQSIPLNNEQLDRCKSILDPKREFTIFPKNPAPPLTEIQFTLGSLQEFLGQKFKEKAISSEAPYIGGEAVAHVLTKQNYASIDLRYNISRKCFGEIPDLLCDFLLSQIDITKFKSLADAKTYIHTFFLYDKSVTEDKWSCLSLGELELKFVYDTTGVMNVSTVDGFQISTSNPHQVYYEGGDFMQALASLKNREMIVENPSKVENLAFCLLDKQTQGFVIRNPKPNVDIIKTALSELVTKYKVNSQRMLGEFQLKFHKHLNKHYKKNDQAGKMIACLNFLSLLQKMDNDIFKQILSKSILATWKSERLPYLNAFTAILQDNLENLNDLLAFVKGIFLLEWVNNNPKVAAYTFDFAKSPNEARPHFGFSSDQRTHYLTVDGHPGDVAQNFLVSWRRLENRLKDSQKSSLLTELAKDIGLEGIIISSDRRPHIVQTLLNAHSQNPIASVISHQYGDNVSLAKFCKVVEDEALLMAKEFPGVVDPAFFKRGVTLYSLRQQLAILLRQKQQDKTDLIKSLIGCLNSPYLSPHIFKELLSEISKPENVQWLKNNDPLANEILEGFFLLVALISDQGELPLMKLTQDYLLQSDAATIFSTDNLCRMVGNLLFCWKPLLETGDLEMIVSIHHFVKKVIQWPSKSPSLQQLLVEIQSHFIQKILPSSEETAKDISTFEKVFVYAFPILMEPGIKKQDAAAQSIFKQLSTLALASNTALALRLTGTLAKHLIQHHAVLPEHYELILNLAKRLLLIPKDALEREAPADAYTSLGGQLIDDLIKDNQNPKEVYTFFLQTFAFHLTSDVDPHRTMQMNKVVQSLSKLPGIGKESIETLTKIVDAHANDQKDALKIYIQFIASLEIGQAQGIFSFLLNMKELPKEKQHRIVWHIVETYTEKATAPEVDYAYLILKTYLSIPGTIIGLKDAAFSLRLISALQNVSSKYALEGILLIVKFLLPTFHHGSHQFKKLKKTTADILNKSIMQTIHQLFLQSYSEHADNLCKTCLDSHIISCRQVQDMLKELMVHFSKEQPNWVLIQRYLEMCCPQELSESGQKEVDSILSPIFEKYLKLDPSPSLIYEWTAMQVFITLPCWSKYVDTLMVRMVSKMPPSESITQEVSLLIKSGIEKILHRKSLKHLSPEAVSALLKMLIMTRQEISYGLLVQEISVSKLPKIFLFKIFTTLVENDQAKAGDPLFLRIFKVILKQNAFTDEGVSSKERAAAYEKLFKYLSKIFEKEQESVKRESYVKLLETQWQQAIPILRLESQTGSISKISTLIIVTFLAVGDEMYFNRICEIMTCTDQPDGCPQDVVKNMVMIYGGWPDNKVKEGMKNGFQKFLNQTLLRCLRNATSINVISLIYVSLKKSFDEAKGKKIDEKYWNVINHLLDQYLFMQKLLLPTFDEKISAKPMSAQEAIHLVSQTHLRLLRSYASEEEGILLEAFAKIFFNPTEWKQYCKHIADVIILTASEKLQGSTVLRNNEEIREFRKLRYLMVLCQHKTLDGKMLLRSMIRIATPSAFDVNFLVEITLLIECAIHVGIFDNKVHHKYKVTKSSLIEALLDMMLKKFHSTYSPAQLIKLLNIFADSLDFESHQAVKYSTVHARFFQYNIEIHDLSLQWSIDNESLDVYQQYLQILKNILRKQMGSDNPEMVTHYMQTMAFSLSKIFYRPVAIQAFIPRLRLLYDVPNGDQAIDRSKKATILEMIKGQFSIHATIRLEASKTATQKGVLQLYHDTPLKQCDIKILQVVHERFLAYDKEGTSSRKLSNEMFVKIQYVLLKAIEELIGEENEKVKAHNKESSAARVLALTMHAMPLCIPAWINPMVKEHIEAFFKTLEKLAKIYAPKYSKIFNPSPGRLTDEPLYKLQAASSK